MSRLDVQPWEANHPLNGNPCPITGRMVYIEDSWKVFRSDYRLRTGILEPGVVISLPVGYTKIADTHTFFENLKRITRSTYLDKTRFVLIEDYSFHTGTDYEGRLTYIKRMIDEIEPAGVVFITQSINWKLSIKMAKVLGGSPFPIQYVETYREALLVAGKVLGRPVAGLRTIKTLDKIDYQNFGMSISIHSIDVLVVHLQGNPSKKNIPSILDFYQGLGEHPKLLKNHTTIHDFSSLRSHDIHTVVQLIRLVLSEHCNHNEKRVLVTGNSLMLRAIATLEKRFGNGYKQLQLYPDCDTAVVQTFSTNNTDTMLAATLQMNALEMLDKISWDQPGHYELEIIQDPHLKPLAFMLGALKQDVDFYLKERQQELDLLEETHNRAIHLSMDIESALRQSEEDRMKAEELIRINLSLSHEISQSQKEVFLVLADYIDRRAKLPEGNTKKLARFVSRLATLFSYTEADADRLHDATLLYHVGYLGLPEDEQECSAHCQVGGEVLGNIYSFLMQYAAQVARSHHEKWNGTGYPDKLIGTRIPREAQLIAIAEFLLEHETIQLDYIVSREAGSAFDPAIVTVITAHIDKIRAWKTSPDQLAEAT